jgi:hypothetical protein
MSRSGTYPAVVTRGNARGAAVVGAFMFFEERYGRAAVHAVVSAMPAEFRAQVSPHAAHLGLLPSRLYSYPLIGAVVRAMIAVVRPHDEDIFLRELASAGMDRTLTTVNRVMLHYMLTPELYAARAQEIWSLYHDSGIVTVLPSRPNEYRVQLSDWPLHDPYVCRIALEARRRSLEHMGAIIVESRREQCQSWGHDVCTHAFRWSSLGGKVR